MSVAIILEEEFVHFGFTAEVSIASLSHDNNPFIEDVACAVATFYLIYVHTSF